MIKSHSIDDHEVPEVILIGSVITMPGHHIKTTVILYTQINNEGFICNMRFDTGIRTKKDLLNKTIKF